MSGDGKPVVQAAPVPFSFLVERIGATEVGDGETVPVLRLIFFTPTGSFVLFLPAPDAAQLADQLREHAGGLRVARDLDGLA